MEGVEGGKWKGVEEGKWEGVEEGRRSRSRLGTALNTAAAGSTLTAVAAFTVHAFAPRSAAWLIITAFIAEYCCRLRFLRLTARTVRGSAKGGSSSACLENIERHLKR